MIVPQCRNCNKTLAPNYDRVCADCGRGWWHHSVGVGGQPIKGACSKVMGRNEGIKKLTGFGYRDCGVFCSLRCGFEFGVEKTKEEN